MSPRATNYIKVVNKVLRTYSIANFLLQPTFQTFTCKTDGSIFCQIGKNRSTSGGDPKSQFFWSVPLDLDESRDLVYLQLISWTCPWLSENTDHNLKAKQSKIVDIRYRGVVFVGVSFSLRSRCISL